MLLNLVLIILSVINPISNETLRDNSQNLRSETDTEHVQLFSNTKFLLESKDERYLRNKELNPIRNIDHNIGNTDHPFGNIDQHLGNTGHHLGNTDHNLGNTDHNLGNTDHNLGNIDHHLGNTAHNLSNIDQYLGNTDHNLSNIDQYLGNTDHHFETQTLDISYLEESEYTLGKKLK